MDYFSTYNIAITPDGMTVEGAQTYTRQVTNVLDWIFRVTTGKILFNSIRFHAQPITISPWTDATTCNSSGGGSGSPMVGVVNYSPESYVHGACAAERTAGNESAFTRDAVLFHELVHVLRAISGKWNKRPTTGGLSYYDDSEEFYAVMLTNIYISDRTNPIKTRLRGEHGNHSPLEKDFEAPFNFFSAGTQVAPLVKEFIQDNHGFAIRVGNDSKAKFNPIADYLADPDRCDQLSRNARLIDRARVISQFPRLGKLIKLLSK